MTVFEKLKSCKTVDEMMIVLYHSGLNKAMKWLTRMLESEWEDK